MKYQKEFSEFTEKSRLGEYRISGSEPIPDYMVEGVLNYVMLGIPPGDFLTGVITNNLKQAVFYADGQNRPAIPSYVYWFYNEAPGRCWGSVGEMEEWMEKGGLIGGREKT